MKTCTNTFYTKINTALYFSQVVVLAIVASALGVPAPEADPQVLLPGATAALGALPLGASPLVRSIAAPAVAVQNPAVFATPAVRTALPAPVAAPLALPALIGKSAPCVNDANIPVPCADGVVAPIAAPVVRAALPAPIAAPVARTVVAAPVAPAVRTVVNAPLTRTVVAAPTPLLRNAPLAVGPVAPARVLTPHDCVTVGGCRLRAALEGRALLVKRDAEATSEAEADPQFLATTAGLPLAYNNLALNNLAYNNLAYNNLAYNNLYSNGLYSNYYNGLYNPYNYALGAPALRTVAAAPAAVAVNAALPAIAAPALRTVAAAPAAVAVNAALPAIAAPAVRTVAQTVVAAPAPVARTVVAAPAVARTVVAPAPVAAPLLRAAPVAVARTPAVVNEAVPVTYTHLGAHPIQPTTTLETRQRLVL